MKAYRKLLFVLLLSLSLSACYINDDVATDQVGVMLNRNEIQKIVSPGVYTDLSFFADLKEVSVGTVTFTVEDPEVATSDNQLVSAKITVQARRRGDEEGVRQLLTNWPALLDDQMLINTVSATAREGIKNGVRAMTLNQLLGDRNTLAGGIMKELKADADKYSVEIVNVTVENVGLDPNYAAKLQANAQYQAEIEGFNKKKERDTAEQEAIRNEIMQQQETARTKAQQEGETLRELAKQEEMTKKAQLKVQEAETAIQVEIAERQGEIVAAQSKVYTQNEQAYELKRLEWMSKIFGDKSVFWMLPAGSDPTLILNQSGGQLVPYGPPAP